MPTAAAAAYTPLCSVNDTMTQARCTHRNHRHSKHAATREQAQSRPSPAKTPTTRVPSHCCDNTLLVAATGSSLHVHAACRRACAVLWAQLAVRHRVSDTSHPRGALTLLLLLLNDPQYLHARCAERAHHTLHLQPSRWLVPSARASQRPP